MKKNVLLLNPPGKKKYFRDNYCSPVSRADYYHQPIDLLVQSGFLREDFHVFILDAIVEDKTNEDVLDLILSHDFFAIFALTGTASWGEDFLLFDKIKNLCPDIILALSGNLALFEHNTLFKKYHFLDVALLDYTTDDLRKFLLGERQDLSQIVFRQGDDIIKHFKKVDKSFSYPLPVHDQFKNNLYHLPLSIRHPSTVLISSAGCPFPCEFCVASEIRYKFRDIDNLINELKTVASMGIREVFYQDFMFEASKKRANEICRRIIEEKIDLTWYCSCRVDILDEELLRNMKNSGCHTILFGIESSEQEALDQQKKGITVDVVRKTIALCNKVGIRPFGNFIVGLPGESKESMLKMGSFARKLGLRNAVFSTIVPDVGTNFREKMIEGGLIDDHLTTFSNSYAAYPEQLNGYTPEELTEIRKKVMLDFYLHPKFLFNNFINVRSFYELKSKIKQGLVLLKRIREF